MKNYVFLQGDKFCYTVELDENYVDNFNLMESLEKNIANAEVLIKNSKSIEISRGIEELRDNCFGNFEKANTIYIPDTIKRIDDSIFAGSDCNIQKIHIAKEVFASNYSKLEKIFGEKFEDKVILKNLYFRDEKIQASFNEYKEYGRHWNSQDKYNLYRDINERLNSDSLKKIITNNYSYKELDSKFVHILSVEKPHCFIILNVEILIIMNK